MRPVDLIRGKRDGAALSREEIEFFVAGVASGAWPDYQVAALLMAIVLRGMSDDETAWLTDAMVRSGVRLDLSAIPGPKVDKHSTGGVGDKTSIVLAPLVAACGALVPMMSGRALGHTGGTLDKLEAIPGFRTSLTLDEMRRALETVGCGLMGQTAEIVPADKRLYAMRDVTATVESIPLITASIMSKKIAEGIGGLVLDVKTGTGAFMKTEADARRLAESLVATGRRAGLRAEALITAMDAPLGRAVGNALEIVECVETLKGRGPTDLEELSVLLAARMLVAGGAEVSQHFALERVREALESGAGLEKLRAIIEFQGGDPGIVDDYTRLPAAPGRHLVRAPRQGYVRRLEAELVGRATIALGAGRSRVDDAIDPAVGALVLRKPGDAVAAGEPVVELHYRRAADVGAAEDFVLRALEIADQPPAIRPLVVDTVS
jgi:pyrimidine-nucleoside phosphorylase